MNCGCDEVLNAQSIATDTRKQSKAHGVSRHCCSGTIMAALRCWTGSAQVMKRGLHTLPQNPNNSQCIDVTVELPARWNSSRLRRRRKWSAGCSGTNWFQSQGADFNEKGYKSCSHGMTNFPILKVNTLKNNWTLAVSVPVNLSVKLDFVSVSDPGKFTLWTRYVVYLCTSVRNYLQ